MRINVRVLQGNTARNPVARAIAAKKVRDRLMATKLRIYGLEPGVDDSEYLASVLQIFQVISYAADLQYPDTESIPVEALRDIRVLRGGMSALVQCLRCWDPMQAVAVEQAADAAHRLNKTLKVEFIAEAGRRAGLIA